MDGEYGTKGMKSSRKPWIWLFLAIAAVALALLLFRVGNVGNKPSPSPSPEPQAQAVIATLTEIEKHGNLALSVRGSDFFSYGYTWGDVVNAEINGRTIAMPVCSNYSEVAQGEYVLCAYTGESGGKDKIELAINMGDLATDLGIATKEKTDADPGYVWRLNEGVTDPVTVTVTMKEAGGYYDQWLAVHLVGSMERSDYPDLTDAQFANFRSVCCGDIGKGRLYRSSSPFNSELNRSHEADAAAEAAGIRVVIDLADTQETVRAYPGFEDSYCGAQDLVALNLGFDFTSADFQEGMCKALRFMAGHEGPYLVHCTEGKDRTGFICAVLENLMGGTEEDVVSDYMMTFQYFYGIEPDTVQYSTIADRNIRKSLAAAYGLETLEGADLRQCAERFLLDCGLTQEEIGAVRDTLAK